MSYRFQQIYFIALVGRGALRVWRMGSTAVTRYALRYLHFYHHIKPNNRR